MISRDDDPWDGEEEESEDEEEDREEEEAEDEDDEEEEDESDEEGEEVDEENDDWEDEDEDEEWVATGGDLGLSSGGYGRGARLNPPPRRTEIQGRDDPWWPTPSREYNETPMRPSPDALPRATRGHRDEPLHLDHAGGDKADLVHGESEDFLDHSDLGERQDPTDLLDAYEQFSDQGLGPLGPAGLGPETQILERFENFMDGNPLGGSMETGPMGPDEDADLMGPGPLGPGL